MTRDDALLEQELRCCLQAYATAGATGAGVLPQVRSRITAALPRRRLRRRWLVVAALAAVGTTPVVAYAISSLVTRPVELHFQSGANSSRPHSPGAVYGTAEAVTLPEAQARAGYHVLSVSDLDGVHLDRVEYTPPVAVDGAAVDLTDGLVGLYYGGASDDFVVFEYGDRRPAGPFVNIFKAGPGYMSTRVETIGGGQYLVGRRANGLIAFVSGETLDGTVFDLGLQNHGPKGRDGLGAQEVRAILDHLH